MTTNNPRNITVDEFENKSDFYEWLDWENKAEIVGFGKCNYPLGGDDRTHEAGRMGKLCHALAFSETVALTMVRHWNERLFEPLSNSDLDTAARNGYRAVTAPLGCLTKEFALKQRQEVLGSNFEGENRGILMVKTDEHIKEPELAPVRSR